MASIFGRVLKGLALPGSSAGFSWSTETNKEVRVTEEDAKSNSAVFMVIDTIATAYPEPPLIVYEEDKDGDETEQVGHELTRLLAKPNPALDEFSHWYITQMYLQSSGNAYWLKFRNGDKKPVQLWPTSDEYIKPKWPRDGSQWISHYEYTPRPGEKPQELAPSEVVHFRIGNNEENNRLGRAPLWYILSEIFSDEEATKFTGQLLKNWGIPPIVIQSTGNPPQSEINRIKAEFAARYSGRMRGNVGFLTGGMTAHQIGSKPSEMQLDFAHRVPEERISGAYGVPAIVAGLGAGLDRATYANFKEAREMFTERKMMSLWRMGAAQVENQLLPDFRTSENEHCKHNTTDVAAMQEDENTKWARAQGAASIGLITRADFKKEIGKVPEADGSDDVYMMPLSIIEVPLKAETEDATITTGADVQTLALNGAQIASLLTVLQEVTAGTLAPETAQGIIKVSFPNISEEQIEAMVSGAVNFEPTAAPGGADAAGDAGKARRRAGLKESRRAAARRLHRALTQSTARAVPGAEKQVQKAFSAIADQVASRVKAAQDAEDIWPSGADKTLEQAITAVYVSQAETAWKLVSEAFDIEGSFSVNHPAVAKALEQSAQRVVKISESTRAALQRTLSAGVDTPRDELRAQIRQVVQESYAGRSAAIARTELRAATNQTSATRYEDAGVTMVDVVDGDLDDLCADRNGQRVTLAQFLEWEASEHPNGTISAIPVLE